MRNSSYSFTPILLKLYIFLYHTLKMCMLFGYNLQNNFDTFCTILTLSFFRHFDNECGWTVGTLCAQLLLKY